MEFWSRLFQPRPPESAKKLHRNDPCWCGSEKKYEHCHYEDDRRYFARRADSICRGPI